MANSVGFQRWDKGGVVNICVDSSFLKCITCITRCTMNAAEWTACHFLSTLFSHSSHSSHSGLPPLVPEQHPWRRKNGSSQVSAPIVCCEFISYRKKSSTPPHTHTYPCTSIFVRTFLDIMSNPASFPTPPSSPPNLKPDLNPVPAPTLKPLLNPQTGLWNV